MKKHDENNVKPVLHLMINNTCTNNCVLCCNKQYDVNTIPIVTLDDLNSVDTVCITGGAPLIKMHSCFNIIRNMLIEHENIHNVYIYANGYEITLNSPIARIAPLKQLVSMFPHVNFGLTMSPKNIKDWNALNNYIKPILSYYKTNRLYCFTEEDLMWAKELFKNTNVDVIKREWQATFKPAPNTIFRRLPIWTIN